MRNLKLVVILCSVFLTASGLLLGYMANNAKKSVPGVDLNMPRHPVTPEMAEAVARMNKKVAPFFKLPDTDGKVAQIGGQGTRPQFLYSVKEGCPCSYDAEPLIQALYKQFEGKIDFIAVTDSKLKEARKWDLDLKVPFSVVSVPNLEVMEAYDYPSSVYCTLIDTNGVIVRRWPGYSKEMLLEMVEEISKLLGDKPGLFDTKYAPVEKTSGCSYTNFKGKPVVGDDYK